MYSITYRRAVQRSIYIYPRIKAKKAFTPKNIILDIPNINRFTAEFLYFTHFTSSRTNLLHNMLYKTT